MSNFVLKSGKETRSITTIQKLSGSNIVDVSSEKKAAPQDAFWANALESASILLWIVTHLPTTE